MEDKCEFYPGPDNGCVCAAGSDVSGVFACTKEYSNECQWARELREHKQTTLLRGQELLTKLTSLATKKNDFSWISATLVGLFLIAVWSTMFYIAYHFISKYW